jgi:cytochrome c oxidase subunit II
VHWNPHDFWHVWDVYIVVTTAAVVAVFAAVAIALIRFRARPGRRPSRRDEATRTEIAYAVFLSLIAAGLLTLTFRTEFDATSAAARSPYTIHVTAAQWRWVFDYAGSSRHQEPVGAHPTLLVMPAGERVHFTLRSVDVVHSFGIPAAHFKRYAFPDRTNEFDLTFARPGTHMGFCYQFCGWQHPDMRFRVRVVPVDQFRRWLAGAPL